MLPWNDSALSSYNYIELGISGGGLAENTVTVSQKI